MPGPGPKQVPRGFVGVNVPACVETGPRTFPTLNSPGRAWKQGPGRFGHVNVPGRAWKQGPGQERSLIYAASTPRA